MPALGKIEIRKLTERDFRKWADEFRDQVSVTVFNHTLGMIRNIIDFGIKAGARYDNPVRKVMRESERPKPLQLPSAENS